MPEPSRVAYLDAGAGLAGDMFLGAAIDAGLDPAVLEETIAALGLEDVRLRVSRVLRRGVSAVHVQVEQAPVRGGGTCGAGRQPARRLPEVLAALGRSGLPEEVVAAATGAFRRLAEVEGRIHGCRPDEVHFHEVGAVDALVDIAGAFMAARALGLVEIYASPVPLGSGTVETAHGRLPVPAPAALALLEGWPVLPGGPPGEVITPTGALLLRCLAGEWRPCPPLRPVAIGYGAGSRDDPDRANVTRLIIGEAAAAAASGQEGTAALLPGADDEEVVVLEANLDDMSPEWCGHLLESLLLAGARDAAVTPLLMKKGRPGWAVMAVTTPETAGQVARVFLKESTTLGLRYRHQRRVCLARQFREVEVAGQRIRIKEGFLGGRRLNLAPEYEDCRRAAAATGLALKEVYVRAQAEALRQALDNGSEQS
ncbi:MAG: nickel pincer cofactor biosynthesis protein LarC [Bacillota bacterium]|nr:nickel pincer cofactor biosynthesis protein LarC [Bacillota bacterium]